MPPVRPVVRALAPTLVCFAAAGCPADGEPIEPVSGARKCGIDVWIKPSSRDAKVELVGSWNDFARPGIELVGARADGFRTTHVDLAAGDYRYALIEDGAWRPDPFVATTAWEGDREVTWVHANDCSVPALALESVEEDGTLVRAKFERAASTRSALDPKSVVVRTRAGEIVEPVEVAADVAAGAIRLRMPRAERTKRVVLLTARDEAGRETAPARAALWSGARAHAKEDTIVYQIVLDRFEGSSGPLAPPSEPGARAGGKFVGVTHAVERGDFDALGVNTLWLSPVYKNPEGFFSGGSATRRFSAYHGYWPIDSRAVDAALGTEAELDALIAAAHSHGLRVLFDVVPNHVHAQHPYWSAREGDVGFNAPDGRCLCGQGDCPWSTSIERCWFAPYLPDLDTRREEVLMRTTEDILHWLDRFEADGLRIDAVPMMPRSTTRRIAALARARFEHPGASLYLVGETFTNEQGFDAIRYNLGPMGLDGQFHFPLMWALRKAVAAESQGLTAIDEAIRAGEDAFRNSGAVMATMIGNHDVTRFASESDGTASGDGFEHPAPIPTDATVFAKQKLALGIVFALPGAPVLYYGDEVALPGRLDPDSRRVMPAESALSEGAREVRAFSRRLGKVRACSNVLRRGRYVPVATEAESWAFVRSLESADSAVAVVMRRPIKPGAPVTLTLDPKTVAPGRYVDALDPARPSIEVQKDGLTTVVVPPFSLRIFLPEGDPCLASQ